ncbi:hypothetical protein FRB93_004448 [Tulasnella sp. JGI-2019a]|nr:hypothetical protein FRB93_004448 [Tulasnella sp. JGI-2019a]
MLTKSQISWIMMNSFNDALKTFSDGLQRLRSTKARHHNTLIPISRLPIDLLVEIFALASGMTEMSKSGSPRRMLATLVYVCHEWRGNVLNAPSLWAYITSSYSKRATLEFLARSGQAPLHLVFDHFDLNKEFNTKMVREVHRWKSVEMPRVTRELLEELEQQPAPLLEKLEVRGDSEMDPGTPNLFCGSANRLCHVNLVDIAICWESNILSGLRTLDINLSRKDGPSAQQVVHVLQLCPNLTSFGLCLPSELHPGPIPLGGFTIELPRLKQLKLRIHPLMTECLLQRMRIPSCKIFDIDQAEATKPIFSAATKHLIPSFSSTLLVNRLDIQLTSNALEYNAVPKIDQDCDEEVDGKWGRRIHIRAYGDQFTNDFALESLVWLLDNVHPPSFSSHISLDIFRIPSSPALTLTIDQLSPVIMELNLGLADSSFSKAIILYLAEPFRVVVDGTTTLKWPLPNLTVLSFE